MKIKVEESLRLEDGKHEGEIEDVQYRDTPYNYVDVIVKIGNGKMTASYPRVVNEDSLLGNLLLRFGSTLEIGKDIEVEEFLTKGKKVEFQTLTKKGKDGKDYSNIIRESLKP